ncbi:MAG TPA: hypothetical protein VN682_22665 [Terriglobales bacterium]|nr:hypothetical protein [Terriglobales bacterium]
MKRAKQSSSKAVTTEVYEKLAEFNWHCSSALVLIDAFGRERVIPSKERRYYASLLREIQSSISQSVMEFLDQREILAAAEASRERQRLEERMLD